MCAYKAAILSALSPRQIFTPAQLGTLNKLCNVFHRRRPPKPSPVPTWYIGLVLCAFTLAPFEPLATTLLEAVTYKTFVLLALALCACRGQFVRPAEDWNFRVVIFRSVVYSKNGQGKLPTEPFKLRALPPGAPPRDDAMVLCPVRALKAYMAEMPTSTIWP